VAFVRSFQRTGLDSHQRRILGWMCALIAVNQLGFGAIVPVVPLYAESYGVSEAAVGLTIAIYGLARFLVNLPAGALADRRGRRWVLALGGIVTVMGNGLCAVAPSFDWFLAARFISGAGAAMVLTGGQIVLADITAVHNRGRVMAIYQGVFMFAVGIGPLPGGLLASRFGLGAPFAFNAALAAGVAVLAWVSVPETRPADAFIGTATKGPSPRVRLRLLGATPGFALISLVSFVAFFARTGALFNVVPLRAKNAIGLGPAQIGLGLGMISIVSMVLAYPSGMLVDRFGRKAVIVPALVLNGSAMLLFAVVPTFGWFVLACLLWGCASAVSGAAPAAYATDVAPKGMMASALGTYRMVADAGYVVGPLALGAIAGVYSTTLALVVPAVLLISMSLIFALLAPETLSRTRTIARPTPRAMPD